MSNRVVSLLTGRRFVQYIFIVTSCVLLAVAVMGRPGPGSAGGGPVAVLSWWFLALAALFVSSLAASTLQQFSGALALLRSLPAGSDPPCRGEVLRCRVPEEALRELGYRRVAASADAVKYVKARWGYFGRPVLHLGLGLALMFGVIYFVTEHRVIVRAVEGIPLRTAELVRAASRGPLAAPLRLPEVIRLVRLTPAYYPNDQLLSLESTVELEEGGRVERRRVAVSGKGSYGGMILYHQGDYGRAFLLRGDDGAGRPVELVLTIPMPVNRTTAGYESFPLAGGLELKAKFYPDRDRRGMVSDTPELVLRLVRGGEALGETSLVPGNSGRVGPYRLTLVEARWWTEFLFEGSWGATGIFTGFFLMVVGALVSYFAAPREVTVRMDGGGARMQWRATRFAEFYGHEREALRRACGEETGGL